MSHRPKCGNIHHLEKCKQISSDYYHRSMNKLVNMDTFEFAKNTRLSVLSMLTEAKSSHIGSCFSAADIVAVLYSKVMKYSPENPFYEMRDRFILSKGHACAVVYAALAESGFFPKSELSSYSSYGSMLTSHISHHVPGVEFSTGSLGHGLPFAVGKALFAKTTNLQWRTFVLLGDGELAEGSNWEALLFASHHKLDNLTVIVDRNNLQSFDTTSNTLNLSPIVSKFESFGCDVTEVDGHSIEQLIEVLSVIHSPSGLPKVVIANTVKGKGVDFMEDKVEWHYKSPNEEEFKAAIEQLEKSVQ